MIFHVGYGGLLFRININVHWLVGTVSADYVDVEQKLEWKSAVACLTLVLFR